MLIFRQNKQLLLFQNLPKNRFWDRVFKNQSTDSRSVTPRDHVCQTSVKMNNFEFFDLNLGKLPNYVRYFGSNYSDKTEMSWVEEVVHGLAIPSLLI